MVTIESISAGLVISLIDNYIVKHKIVDKCMEEQDYAAYEVSSVVAGVSDSACVRHVHI